MPPSVKTFDTPQQLAQQFAQDFTQWIDESTSPVCVSLSGGSTPQLLFQHWASKENQSVDWSRVHFFWGDERCVPPTHPDSNFGVANSLFFQPAGLATENIHRIRGEDDPELEKVRYADEIQNIVPCENGIPKFDIMILGMGSDGHTASLFPNQMQLMDSDDTCAIARHPESGQLRISLTGPVIANASRIVFLITGNSKTEKVAAILENKTESKLWPATRFFHLPTTCIYLDRDAAT